MQTKVFSLLVNNNTGLLSRVAGLFSRRGYNIDSITSGTTMDKSLTLITVVATGDTRVLSQIEKQLSKLEDVVDIKILEDGKSVCRELIMVKIRANASQRAEVISIADIFRAKIVDVEAESLMLEMTGNRSKVEAFLNLLSSYEILELARTGLTGLSRGSDGVFDTEA
jgi:acetolactate synthase-1/3 small subunit